VVIDDHRPINQELESLDAATVKVAPLVPRERRCGRSGRAPLRHAHRLRRRPCGLNRGESRWRLRIFHQKLGFFAWPARACGPPNRRWPRPARNYPQLTARSSRSTAHHSDCWGLPRKQTGVGPGQFPGSPPSYSSTPHPPLPSSQQPNPHCDAPVAWARRISARFLPSHPALPRRTSPPTSAVSSAPWRPNTPTPRPELTAQLMHGGSDRRHTLKNPPLRRTAGHRATRGDLSGGFWPET